MPTKCLEAQHCMLSEVFRCLRNAGISPRVLLARCCVHVLPTAILCQALAGMLYTAARQLRTRLMANECKVAVGAD